MNPNANEGEEVEGLCLVRINVVHFQREDMWTLSWPR